MKKLFFVPVVLALFLLSACNKWKDFWDDHNDNDNDYKSYQITRWDRQTGPGEDYTGTVGYFTYDNHNNPLTVFFNNTTTGENGTHFTFMYDNQKRLSRCYMHYDINYKEYAWYNKYIYGSNGKIVADTTWLERTEQDPEIEPTPETDSYSLSFYTYDAQGRIIKFERFDEGAQVPYISQTYSYDANGNMVRPGFTYDNKVNFMRTNKVWQFINRDYSKNNPIPAVSYNNAKLPKEFDTTATTSRFMNRSYNHSTFTYKKVD
jgi:hypothetical protein